MKPPIITLAAALLLPLASFAAVSADDLLPPEKAFVPTVRATDKGVDVSFDIAEGYYMYQSKITADTDPAALLADKPEFSAGAQKEDEFFGKQTVYHRHAEVKWAYAKTAPANYKITLHYQGCAEAGVCYPPVDTELEIAGAGEYRAEAASNDARDMFVKKPQAGAAAASSATAGAPLSREAADAAGADARFVLSRDTLAFNLFWFFVFGLGLSFTACMYPLLPIVSSIIVG